MRVRQPLSFEPRSAGARMMPGWEHAPGLGASCWYQTAVTSSKPTRTKRQKTVRRADGFYFFTSTTAPKAVLKLTSFAFSFSGFQAWFPRFVAAAKAQVRAWLSKRGTGRLEGGLAYGHEEALQLSEGGGCLRAACRVPRTC